MPVLVVCAILGATTSSLAEEGESFRYGLLRNNLVFKTVEEAKLGGSFRLAVKGGQPAYISVELVDIVSDSSGFKKSIPVNSSPFTSNGLVEFATSYPNYEPSDEFLYFDISLKFNDGIDLERPVLGGLSISIIPEEQTRDQVAVASSIVATFAYIPGAGIDLKEYAPALTLKGPDIERKTGDFFPLNLLPNLPFVSNHGDLGLGYQLTNTGKIFLETTTEVIVQQVGLLGQRDVEVFRQSSSAFLVPGQQANQALEILQLDSENQSLDIGLYYFKVTSTGQMGDQIETSTSNQEVHVIFPWKQSLFVLGLLVFLRRSIKKAFSGAVAYAQALREFRYSRHSRPNQVQEPNPVPKRTFSANLGSILPKLLRPKTKSNSLAETKSSQNSVPDALQPGPAVISPKRRPSSSDSEPSKFEAKPLYPYWYQPPKKGS